MLTKDVPTATVAAALAAVSGQEGVTVTPTSTFGYDIRNDSHCGAGAPRYNVLVTDGIQQALYFAGCSSPPPLSSVSINTDWTRKVWTPTQFVPQVPNPPIPLIGSQIVSITIVFDEGTDEATLDNIAVNGIVAGGPAVAKAGT